MKLSTITALLLFMFISCKDSHKKLGPTIDSLSAITVHPTEGATLTNGPGYITTDSTAKQVAEKHGDSTIYYAVDKHGKKTLLGFSAPCAIDTLKGILIWHAGDSGNDGNTWEWGYWIGKCGPVGAMPLEYITFVPGVAKMTQEEEDSTGKPLPSEEAIYPNEDDHSGFYDVNFKKIAAEKVYGLVIIRYPIDSAAVKKHFKER